MNPSELRAMVRDVLREALPQKSNSMSSIESVRISNDHELADFVRRVLERQDAIKAGQLRFTLAGNTHVPPSTAVAVLTGVVTEQMVDKHAGSGILLLSADAVITPLARDRARRLNLKIERRR